MHYDKDTRQWLAQRRRLAENAALTYYGKLALLQTFDELGIDNKDVCILRDKVRRLKIALLNRGML